MTAGSGVSGRSGGFTIHYEAVRTWAVARPRPTACPAGAAVLLQQGVAAWLRAWPLWRAVSPADPAEPGAPRGPTVSRVTQSARMRALAGVLATMVEHCQQEERS